MTPPESPSEKRLRHGRNAGLMELHEIDTCAHLKCGKRLALKHIARQAFMVHLRIIDECLMRRDRQASRVHEHGEEPAGFNRIGPTVRMRGRDPAAQIKRSHTQHHQSSHSVPMVIASWADVTVIR